MEELEARGFDEISDCICATHVADRYLTDVVATERVPGICLVCQTEDDRLVPLEQILYQMMSVIRSGMRPADGDEFWPTFDTIDVLYHFFEDTFAVEDPVDIFERMVDVIESMEWVDEEWLDSVDAEDQTPSTGWTTFRSLVEHTSRFIFMKPGQARGPAQGRSAAQFVDAFQRMLVRNSHTLVTVLEAGAQLHRGRLVRSAEEAKKLFSHSALGAPPDENAAANRMSPAGISMFYASGDARTAVAEIAAHDSEQREHAVVGAFRTLRPLRLLDLSTIDQISLPSVFDEARWQERADISFLKSFTRDITRPIRLDGREHREYAPTQVLTELIRWAPDPQVDGIALPSAQSGLPTYVLFFASGSTTGEPSVEDLAPTSDAVFSLAPDDVSIWRIERRVEATRLSLPGAIEEWRHGRP
jgi:hypothetical protein